jgi:uncharacterized membrane protein
MMINGLCHSGNWGSLGNFGMWGWAGLILYLIFWNGLIAGLTLLAVRLLLGARMPVATVPTASRQPMAKELLQAQYAHGEITRDDYDQMRRDLEG